MTTKPMSACRTTALPLCVCVCVCGASDQAPPCDRHPGHARCPWYIRQAGFVAGAGAITSDSNRKVSHP